MYAGARRCLASNVLWVRFPPFPLVAGCWSKGKTPASQVGNRGSTPRRSTERAHGPMGRHQPGVLEIWVQFPVGPLGGEMYGDFQSENTEISPLSDDSQGGRGRRPSWGVSGCGSLGRFRQPR